MRSGHFPFPPFGAQGKTTEQETNFSIAFLASLFPLLPMSGQFLCVLPVNNFVYYFVSFIPFISIFCNFMRQLLAKKATLWACHSC